MRTLLLERDSDLARVFTEQSFFALSRETEAGWAERLGFRLEPGPGRARLHQGEHSIYQLLKFATDFPAWQVGLVT